MNSDKNYLLDVLDTQGLILPKKVKKNSGFLTQFLDFGYCDPTKNYWILFSEIWPASCTKKLDPIFFRFIQKNLRVQNFQIYPEKKLDLRIFVGRIKPRSFSLLHSPPLRANNKINPPYFVMMDNKTQKKHFGYRMPVLLGTKSLFIDKKVDCPK